MRNEKGVVTLLVALVLPILFFFIALIADIGMLHVQRSQAQTMVDSASLAGVTISDNEIGEMEMEEERYWLKYHKVEKEWEEYHCDEQDRYRFKNPEVVYDSKEDYPDGKYNWRDNVSDEGVYDEIKGRSIDITEKKYWEVHVEHSVDVSICDQLSRNRATSMIVANIEYVVGEPEVTRLELNPVNPDKDIGYMLDTIPHEIRENLDYGAYPAEPHELPDETYVWDYRIEDVRFDDEDIEDANAFEAELTLEVSSLIFGSIFDREGKVEISVESRSEVDPEELLY